MIPNKPFPSLPDIVLAPSKRVFFAADFHLGSFPLADSKKRELLLVEWMEMIKPEVQVLFLQGDIFDFWFDYKDVAPKGFLRFLGKLAELADLGIPIYIFRGNHDMWMFDYLPDELGPNVRVLSGEYRVKINEFQVLVGHGDGLGPGDYLYKLLKVFFANKLCQRLFASLHPSWGFFIAQGWSRKSRKFGNKRPHLVDKESEFLVQYCRECEASEHFDFYIFGHRHKPLYINIENNSNKPAHYINLGEWIGHNTYVSFDGSAFKLEKYHSGMRVELLADRPWQ